MIACLFEAWCELLSFTSLRIAVLFCVTIAAACQLVRLLCSLCLPSWKPLKPFPRVNCQEISYILEADSHTFRKQLYDFIVKNASELVTSSKDDEMTILEQRQTALKRLRLIVQSGLIKVQHIIEDPLLFFAAHEIIALTDPSTIYLFSVFFNLFGGSVLRLGTEKHHQQYLPLINKLDVTGCFALTEFRHGVMSGMYMDTTATYIPDEGVFDLNTPNVWAHKTWISFAANHAQVAVVFAKLIINDKDEGVHAFLVQLRESETGDKGAGGRICPGIRIEDQGPKATLDGNDNARLFFNHVRIPRENLLDRFSQVSKSGVYTSSINKVNERFLKVSAQLGSGRSAIGCCAIVIAKLTLLATIRYSVSRMQDRYGKSSVSLLTQQSQRRALLPQLTACFAFSVTASHCKQLYARKLVKGEVDREAETAVFGFKAYATRWAVDVTALCRQKTGGQGLLACNRIADLNNVAESLVVVEGDAMILAQKVAKNILDSAMDGIGGSFGFFIKAYSLLQMYRLKVKIYNVMGGSCVISMIPLLLQARVECLTFQLAMGMGRDKGRLGMTTAWSEYHLNTALLLHRAYVEHMAWTQLQLSVTSSVTSPTSQSVLQALLPLFGLSLVQQDLGWFMTHLGVSGCLSREIDVAIDHYCRWITDEDALKLVECFGFPEELITMPIAKKGGDGWIPQMP